MRLVDGIDVNLAEELAKNVGPAGIDVAYQRSGDPSAPPVLMIMGLGAQMTHWPDSFCHELAFTRAFTRAFGEAPGQLRRSADGSPPLRRRREAKGTRAPVLDERIERVPELVLVGLARWFSPANYGEFGAL